MIDFAFYKPDPLIHGYSTTEGYWNVQPGGYAMGSIKNNYCPVCGYDLGFASWVDSSSSDEICPCCGIQYGYDDVAGGDVNKRDLIYNEWRNRWIKERMSWKSIEIKRPDIWDPVKQLENLK